LTGDVSTTDDKDTLTKIGTDTDWAFVAASYYQTFAIKTDGSLYAWGDNSYGQLGNGTTDDKYTPTRIGVDTDWAQNNI
jgi:alpha-tubulin suppressor-like RCC1 family protein